MIPDENQLSVASRKSWPDRLHTDSQSTKRIRDGTGTFEEVGRLPVHNVATDGDEEHDRHLLPFRLVDDRDAYCE